MVDFSGLADKAKNLVAEHSDQVKGGVDKVGEFVGNKIGHDKVDPIENKIGEFVDKIAGDKTAGDEHPVRPATPATPPVVPPPAAPPVTPPV